MFLHDYVRKVAPTGDPADETQPAPSSNIEAIVPDSLDGFIAAQGALIVSGPLDDGGVERLACHAAKLAADDEVRQPTHSQRRLDVPSHQVGDTRLSGVVPMPVWMRSVW